MNQVASIDIPFTQKGFVTGVAFDDKRLIYAMTCTDHKIHLYQKGVVRIKKYNVLQASDWQQRIWYLPRCKKWITAGKDFRLREWDIDQKLEDK